MGSLCHFYGLELSKMKERDSTKRDVMSPYETLTISPTTSLSSCDSCASSCSEFSVDLNPYYRSNQEEGTMPNSREDSSCRVEEHKDSIVEATSCGVGGSNMAMESNFKEFNRGHKHNSTDVEIRQANHLHEANNNSVENESRIVNGVTNNGNSSGFYDEIESKVWDPPEAEDPEDDMQGGMAYDDDDDDDDECGDGTKWGSSSSLSNFRVEGSGSYRFKEEKQKALDEVINGTFKALVTQLLRSFGVAPTMEGGESWADIITSLSWEAAFLLKPDAVDGKGIGPDGYVKIKCIATGTRSQSQVIKGLVFKKHAAHKHMPTDYKNPKLLLIRGVLGQSLSSLSSFNAMKQEDYLKPVVEMIEVSHPNVILVEKSVSRDIQESILAKGMTLVFDMKLHRLERIARCTGSSIVSTDTVAIPKLKQCESFRIEKFVEEHAGFVEGEKKPIKTLMFLEGCPTRLGCTILLKGSHSDELKKIKSIVQCSVGVAYHLILETAFLVDQRAMFSTIPLAGFDHHTPDETVEKENEENKIIKDEETKEQITKDIEPESPDIPVPKPEEPIPEEQIKPAAADEGGAVSEAPSEAGLKAAEVSVALNPPDSATERVGTQLEDTTLTDVPQAETPIEVVGDEQKEKEVEAVVADEGKEKEVEAVVADEPKEKEVEAVVAAEPKEKEVEAVKEVEPQALKPEEKEAVVEEVQEIKDKAENKAVVVDAVESKSEKNLTSEEAASKVEEKSTAEVVEDEVKEKPANEEVAKEPGEKVTEEADAKEPEKDEVIEPVVCEPKEELVDEPVKEKAVDEPKLSATETSKLTEAAASNVAKPRAVAGAETKVEDKPELTKEAENKPQEVANVVENVLESVGEVKTTEKTEVKVARDLRSVMDEFDGITSSKEEKIEEAPAVTETDSTVAEEAQAIVEKEVPVDANGQQSASVVDGVPEEEAKVEAEKEEEKIDKLEEKDTETSKDEVTKVETVSAITEQNLTGAAELEKEKTSAPVEAQDAKEVKAEEEAENGNLTGAAELEKEETLASVEAQEAKEVKAEEEAENGIAKGDDQDAKPTPPPTDEPAKDGHSTKASRDLPAQEVLVKKQSGNIMSKVKQLGVKVKKAIVGKSPISKTPTTEAKGEEKVK